MKRALCIIHRNIKDWNWAEIASLFALFLASGLSSGCEQDVRVTSWVKGYLSSFLTAFTVHTAPHIYIDASHSIFEWGHCWWWCFARESLSPVSARECDVSPERDEDSVSLLRGITFAIQVRASSTQRQSDWPPPQSEMTPGETHFPDKWAAVISIGLFGQKCPFRSLFMAAGLAHLHELPHTHMSYKCSHFFLTHTT